MSYSDFTLERLQHEFGLTIRDQRIFDPVGSIEPSAWLLETLKRGQDQAVVSEKARSEFIVAPVLGEVRGILDFRFRVYSGARLDVDPSRGLKGECDFILARSESALVFQAPLMVILEAKKNDIELGLGQCAAQLIAAMLYNEREGRPVSLVHGCVTTGESWQFVKLQAQNLLVHPERFPMHKLNAVLWCLVEGLRESDPIAGKAAA